MDHAEVRAWLEEAFFRPGALRRLGDDGVDDEPGMAAVRVHLAECAECRQELLSLRATGLALDVGLGPSPAAEGRMLAGVRALGRRRDARPADSGLAPPRVGLLRAAAVLGILLLAFGAGALAGVRWLAPQPAADGPRLEQAAAALGELTGVPDAQQIQLHDRANAPAGLVVHSAARQRLAVLTSSLEQPATGRYGCYMERDGERTFIGPMHFDGDMAFWAGPVGDPSDAGLPGDRFLVTMEDENEVVLWGQF